MATTTVDDLVLADLVSGYKNENRVSTKLKEEEPEFLEVEEEVKSAISSTTKKYSDITGAVPAGKQDFDIPCYAVEDWDEEGRSHIPDIDPLFVWDHSVAYPLLKAYVLGLKVLVVGPTGSGKTETNKQIAAHLNQPYFRINGRQDMEADTLLGKPWVSGGEMRFEMGDLPKALKKGWYVAFDEPWKTPAGIQMALQRFYERGGVLQLDDMPGSLEEKTIIPDKRSHLVLADNVVGTGDNMDKFGATLIQDASTINRMDLVLFQDYLPQKDEANMIVEKYKFIPEGKAKNVVKLANLIRRGFEQGELSATMSPRNIMSWMELAFDMKDYKESFKYVMLNRFSDDNEKGAVRGHWTTVFGDSLD